MPSKQPGETVRLALHYNGQPLEAPAPPWVGGFTWARTEDGSHWIATSMQLDGADLWIPCKDHPSDEPDSVAINITIPAPLYLASTGSLRRHHGKQRRHAHVSLVSFQPDQQLQHRAQYCAVQDH